MNKINNNLNWQLALTFDLNTIDRNIQNDINFDLGDFRKLIIFI